jgi:hypothetical protein
MMARHERADPLVGTERLLIDGSNLLHALGRARGGPAPAATLVGRLRAVIPAAVRIELILDGAPDPGLRGTRIASGLTVRHSGSASADRLIERLVADAIGSGGTPDAAHAAADAILVVTDDIELGQRVRRRGSRSAGTPWLTKRLDRGVLSAPSAGTPRPARPARPTKQARSGIGPPADRGDDRQGQHSDDGDDDRGRWQPGRGATKKTGNPKRGRPPELPR